MKRTRIIAMIISGFVFIIALINPIKVKKEEIPEEDLVQVVMARVDIENKIKITDDMLEVKRIHKYLVPENSISKKEEVVGKISLVSMFKGDVFIPQKIEEVGNSSAGLAASIPLNMRAITMNVAPDTGVAGLIKVGNKVDIISILKEEPRERGVLLLQKREVLAVDNIINPNISEYTNEGYYVTITLAVTPEEALKFSLAQTMGISNRAILRNQEDGEVIDIESITQIDIVK
ncbi:pilus assembly protein CpaB [Tissierella praeacuta]|uniref:Flp pilus assembly protein CpaB n=1 Tax=Tissierella praeacuta TaxID=43131 RepID=UPI00104D2E7C|nr:Flp pilus assembly protein CpaB [Tissierella praeacuta]TCU67839.1 pilus assembly protein CpaB [Tissierella praeacuta]